MKLSLPRFADDDDEEEKPKFAAGSILSLTDYDKQVGLPVSWADAIKREQLVGEQLKNEASKIEMEKAKGELLTEKQVRERDDAWNRAAADEAEKVQRLLDGMDGITPEQRGAFLDRFKTWRKGLSDALAKVNR